MEDTTKEDPIKVLKQNARKWREENEILKAELTRIVGKDSVDNLLKLNEELNQLKIFNTKLIYELKSLKEPTKHEKE